MHLKQGWQNIKVLNKIDRSHNKVFLYKYGVTPNRGCTVFLHKENHAVTAWFKKDYYQ